MPDPTMHHLTATPTRYPDEAGKKLDVVQIVRVFSRYARGEVRMKFGLITETGSARQIHQGPLVPGPWAFGFPLSSVITADPRHSSGAEAERNRAAGIEFDAAIGDEFTLEGRVYVLTEERPRSDYPTLTLKEGTQPDSRPAGLHLYPPNVRTYADAVVQNLEPYGFLAQAGRVRQEPYRGGVLFTAHPDDSRIIREAARAVGAEVEPLSTVDTGDVVRWFRTVIRNP